MTGLVIDTEFQKIKHIRIILMEKFKAKVIMEGVINVKSMNTLNKQIFWGLEKSCKMK